MNDIKKIKLIINNKEIEMSLKEIINEYENSSYNLDDRINDDKVKLFITSEDGLNAVLDGEDLIAILDYSKHILDNGYTWMQKRGFRLD